MRILILGSTGSIGQQSIEVITQLKHQICGISFFLNDVLALKQINDYQIPFYYSPNFINESNVNGFDELIKISKPDLIINAVSGYMGLKLTLLVIKNKIDLALANKESLVMGGYFINEMIKQNKVRIYPIDSEHSSLYELLYHQNINNINQLIITCSGGRFYNYDQTQLKTITYKTAIQHPNWKMGAKISIDSATLINKCFEIVEAYWLFGIKNIIALYHPQSIVHSMIEFKDYSVFANMSNPDMKIAIQSAINKFNQDKSTSIIKPLNFTNLNLSFNYLDKQKWKPIQWAYQIINDNNHSLGIIINICNEIAIEHFKKHKITFDQIIPFIQQGINQFQNIKVENVDDIFKLITLINNQMQ